MNETIGVIKGRRSIRRYGTEQVSNSEVQAILECGMWAPSAMNQQEWHFTVIEDKKVLDRIGQAMKEGMLKSGNERLIARAREGFAPFFGAPTVIMISAEAGSRFKEIDCGAAAENIALAAESLNIGSCLMTSPSLLFESAEGESLKRDLFPEGYVHVCTVALGYKEGEAPAPRPRRPDLATWLT